jgi:CBS domain-containing protein
MKVEQIMSREVVTVTPDTPLKDVALLLVRNRISGVPVCDEDGAVLGVVSEGDILWKELGEPAPSGGLLGWLLEQADAAGERAEALTAGEAMTAPALTIRPDATVAEAARSMIDHEVNRLPVVEDGRLVGLVARADLVRAFTRPDDEIASEIHDDVLLHKLWVDPREVSVTVEAGAVALSGEVENRTIAELIEQYVRRVPGVVGVESKLRWKVDDHERRVAAGADHLPRHLRL